jgi:WD40 repeat protein/cellulose biosynthesis protein BcsQ
VSAPSPLGRIITFYSYKGGTGRTMLLANVAWILASNGKKVLVVDWDLEAPGLHRHLRPFLMDPELVASRGLIDLVTDYAVLAMTKGEDGAENVAAHADIPDYAIGLDAEFPEPGTIDFVPAGKQGPSYAGKVNSFNWQNFYDRLGGGPFLAEAKRRARERYDYVLIDSRTGVSDTAGICTVDLPDTLVVCFTMNNQSVEGASAIAKSVLAQRHDPGFRIFPVPTRIEDGEKHKLDLARDLARGKFAEFIDHIPKERRAAYWGDVEQPYKIFYAYEEILAVFGDRPDQPNSLLSAAERLTGHLTNDAVKRLAPMPDEERRRLLASFERGATSPTTAPAEKADGGLSALIAKSPLLWLGGFSVTAAIVTLVAAKVVLQAFSSVRPSDMPDAGLVPVSVVGTAASPPKADEKKILAAVNATNDTLVRLLLLTEIDETSSEETIKLARAIANGPIPTAVLQGHTRELVGAAFSDDGERVFTSSLDGTVRVWRAADGSFVRTISAGGGAVSSFDVASDLVAIGTTDGASGIWSLDANVRPHLFPALKGRVNDVRFQQGGQRLVKSLEEDGAYLWSVSANSPEVTADDRHEVEAGMPVIAAAFAKSGQHFVTLARDRVSVWNVDGVMKALDSRSFFRTDRAQSERPSPHPLLVLAALAHDGDAVAAAYDDGSVQRCKIGGGKIGTPTTFKGQPGFVSALAVTSGSVATGARNGAVEIWSSDKPDSVKLSTHTKTIRSVAFSADGKHVLTASDDASARVSSVSGDVEFTLQGSDAPLIGAVFGPDGQYVVTVVSDKTAWLWHVAPDPNKIPSYWSALRPYLRKQTTACLDARQYTTLLGDTPEVAQGRNDACVRARGQKE